MVQPGSLKMMSHDITAKALGDLHHHIDKAAVKNPNSDASTATRNRELNPLAAEEVSEDMGMLARVQPFLLRFRIVSSLIYAFA